MAGCVPTLKLAAQPLQEGWLRAVWAYQRRFHCGDEALTKVQVLCLEAHGGVGAGKGRGLDVRWMCCIDVVYTVLCRGYCIA